MTTLADEKAAIKAEREAQKARELEMANKEKELNKDRTGKGTRIMLGMTRGRNPQEIKYEAFDESQPATLPVDVAEFMSLYESSVGSKLSEPTMVSFLIDGFNSASYSAASDPVAEFVDAAWDDDTKKQFRIVVRNYSIATGNSIEDAVALIKPGIVAAQLAKASATK